MKRLEQLSNTIDFIGLIAIILSTIFISSIIAYILLNIIFLFCLISNHLIIYLLYHEIEKGNIINEKSYNKYFRRR